VNVEPAPSRLFTQIRPPCSSMNFRQRVSPPDGGHPPLHVPPMVGPYYASRATDTPTLMPDDRIRMLEGRRRRKESADHPCVAESARGRAASALATGQGSKVSFSIGQVVALER